MNFKKAFTLIELMVVITIISILASMTVLIIQQSQVKVHDKEVISNFNMIKKSLISYYADKKAYPESKGNSVSGCPSGWEIGNTANSGNFLNDLKAGGEYISIVPKEKQGGDFACSYRYNKIENPNGCQGKFMILFARCSSDGCGNVDIPSCYLGNNADLVNGSDYVEGKSMIYMSME